MKQKAFTLQNKGMNRDLSISKAGESSAYENHNIRIIARDHDTLLSVTNERGNKPINSIESVGDTIRITEDSVARITEDEIHRIIGSNEFGPHVQLNGELVGWNVLNNHIVLFTRDNDNNLDYIYRVDYYKGRDIEFEVANLFVGNLGFSLNNPIESIVYYETEDIQKIYWVDGKSVLRFMNFMEKPDPITGLYPWQNQDASCDDTYFDSNRSVNFGIDVEISKDNSGNTRPNGVIQYLLTYYNKHGQESGYVWISDLVYLSPISSGGAADSTNNNAVTLKINNLDTRFTHFRIYSIFRSALNGTTVANIVYEGKTNGESAVVVDNNSHLTAVDASSLLYLGSQNVIASTLTHKDQTLFLGDLSSVDRDYTDIENLLKSEMIQDGWESKYIEFEPDTENKIPNETGSGNYSYNSQLVYTSSQITSFKGGEKYRFGIVFHKKDGTLTDAFWIGDKVNTLYPIITDTDITRIIAKCTLPQSVIDMMGTKEYKTAQLMIAEATCADRSVKAQGIICPTVFNVWNRYQNRVYASSSWMMRPRNSEYAWKHFAPIDNATTSTGEIDCNYWTGSKPNPYYVLNNYATTKDYAETFDVGNQYDYGFIVYQARFTTTTYNLYYAGAIVVLVKVLSGTFNPSTYQFGGDVLSAINDFGTNTRDDTVTFTVDNLEITVTGFKNRRGSWWMLDSNESKDVAIELINKEIHSKYGFIGSDYLVKKTTFRTWCANVTSSGVSKYFNNNIPSATYSSSGDAANDISGQNGLSRWIDFNEDVPVQDITNYTPSYNKKHLMFIDENVVTLNSPEIEYEAVSFDNVDGYKFRIVGIAKINGWNSDYTVDASPSKKSGESLVSEKFKNELIAWPLWREFGLTERVVEEGGDPTKEDDKYVPSSYVPDRDSYDYVWGGNIVRYWLRMWNHSGKINGYTDYDNNDYSRLIRKVFANSRFSNSTIYGKYKDQTENRSWECTPDSIRIFNYTSSQYVRIKVGEKARNYDGIMNDSLMPPGSFKYPVLFNVNSQNPNERLTNSDEPFLYLSDPVSITYSSTPHAVISLPTKEIENNGKILYQQTILPKWEASGSTDNERIGFARTDGTNTGALLPWINNTSNTTYPYKDYAVKQDSYKIPDVSIGDATEYVYIGELYADYSKDDKIRYGGTSDAAIQNNRFVIAGPQFGVTELSANGGNMIANQGDTYIQRWDCLKTKPFSSDSVNNVIDITSVMLETHINIDGRTDLQRGTSYIASIDSEKWGSLNPVYSQKNNFVTQRDLDEDFNLDTYRSSITWTLEKHDSAEVDEWSHITLASTLKLDGDKGICNALHRLGNTIIAFQEHGISEILFNSRTQLSTTQGVPVEIANSGKVDGKRYITNKYGCTNKWSIVEGKNALYFVDNINKAFCSFNGQAIENLSTKLGFGVWFREVNNTEPWRPVDFNNIVSYYDKVHSDVYLVRNTDDNMPCLVYNENLGAFTSFFDYNAVSMMSNVEDRFLSYKNNMLWLQNEGLYCNFYGEEYPYWINYRITPDPFLDKIWTNIDYRADFYEVLDASGKSVVSESNLINGDILEPIIDTYKEEETFSDYRVWNEYQDTGFIDFNHEQFDRDDVRKKFRIWRLTIPRALKEGTNKHGMDRIRNPWINLLFRKNGGDSRNLMQLHDIVVKYFE